MGRRNRFFLSGLLLTVVGLAVRSINIAFNSYITKTVGAEGIGLFTLIMNVYSFAITFATSGISLTVTRLIAEAVGIGKIGKCRKIIKNAIMYCLLFSIVSASVMFFFSDYIALSLLGDKRSSLPLRILALSLPPISVSSVISGYFIGVKRVSRNALAQVLCQAFKIVCTVYVVFYFSAKGTVFAVAGLTLSITLCEIFCVIVVTLTYFIDRKRYLMLHAPERASFFDVTRMALPLAVSAYIRSALITLEHAIIPKALMKRGENVAGALSSYGILHGMALPMLIYPMSVLTSFAGLLVPEFAESYAKAENLRMKRLAGEALGTTLTYSVAVAVFMSIFAEEIGYVLYNSYYAGHYIAMMSIVIPVMYLDHVADSMLKGIGEHVYSMWVNILDAMLSVFLVWLIIPIMGIGGYAVVIVVMEGFNFILSIKKLYTRLHFSIEFGKYFWLPLACALFSAVVCKKFFVMSGREADGLWLFLKIVFAVCMFIASYMTVKKAAKSKRILKNQRKREKKII